MATFSVRVRYDGVHAARQRGQCVWGMTVPVGHLTHVCEAGVVWICRATDILRFQNFGGSGVVCVGYSKFSWHPLLSLEKSACVSVWKVCATTLCIGRRVCLESWSGEAE